MNGAPDDPAALPQQPRPGRNGVNEHDDPVARRTVRRLALAGALQIVRARQGWNVTEAAAHAGMAPMTWRRAEDGLGVREKSLAALDRVLDVAIGTVKRAMADDVQMLGLLRLVGVDVRHVADADAAGFLASFADQMRTDSPRQQRTIGPAPAQSSLIQFAQPGFGTSPPPADQPTDLELVNRMVERLTSKPVTPAIRELLNAAWAAWPDLMDREIPDLPEAG